MCAPEPSATIKNVCPRCSNGRPICTDRKPDGSAYSHLETCATYEWGTDVCPPCAVELYGDKEQAAEWAALSTGLAPEVLSETA